MADSPRIEVVPTEHFPSHVVGARADAAAAWGVVVQGQLAGAGDGAWSDAVRHGVVRSYCRRVIDGWSRWTEIAPPVADVGSTFLQMVEIPGERVAVALGRWWRRQERVDDRLRLQVPREVDGAWSLSGAFRTTAFSRAVPVELLLSPYLSRWTRFELMPRRRIRPNRIYFREGNRALDRVVAAIRTEDRRLLGDPAWSPIVSPGGSAGR